ncbi:MAG: signal peptidase II [Oscillospiraceae bacterium]|nr:signal peptidase II [Oscillospiraceae bacterium]
MTYILMAIFGVLILVGDQVTKYLTVANIDLYEHISVIPGFMGLTYVQNKGAAFSMLQGQQWLFAVIFAVFAVFIVWEFSKKRLPFKAFERWCIVAVFAGGLGNMIDRLRLGYVVDMIATEFIDFPVFNVADCFITCGCILLIAHLAFFNRDFWKEEKKQ